MHARMPAACAIVRSAHRSSLLEINEDISVLPQIAGVCEQTASGDILLLRLGGLASADF